ncbi:MAG: 2-oxo acid dehydrogenase subunit E2 [Propionibacteriales bacterium]|nr:2-oxo acid dehydrogenase subunit E2 [Propionibacteriales bacterium]
MPEVKQFKLPDVGEGLTEAEIVSWKVKPGDSVEVNQVVVEIETAKSLVELPSPYAGTVADLLVPEGETVPVGTPIIGVQTGDQTAETPKPEPAAPEPAGVETAAPEPAGVETAGEEEAVEPGMIGGPAPGGRTAVLVGYGPRTTEAKRRPRKHGPGVATEQAPAAGESGDAVVKVLAKPPVRKLAKDLGVDLTRVTPSGIDGIITRADVEAFASRGPVPAPAPVLRGERETRVPIKGVRKMTAQAMVSSAFTAPHVTEWITVDATRTMRFVNRLRRHREFRDVKVSPLLVVSRAVCLAVRRTPEVNASWDEAAQEIVLKHYVNLGIAAATERGLVVPNIKDADQLSLRQFTDALNALTATARDGKTQPAEMQGGSFTITNVGVFGVDSGTPIINPGESAILAMGAIRRQPWVHNGRIKPRWVTTLAVSFDHRVVDGQQGSRFLADVAEMVEDPSTALLH